MKRSRNNNAFLIKVALLVVFALLSVFELPRLWDSGLSLYAFDVGQADSFLFHLPDGRNILIDAGTRKSGDYLVSRLRRLGVKKIDVVVATHPHEDHIGGMLDVLKAFDVERFWDSGFNHGSEVQRSMLALVRDEKARFERPKAGYREDFGDVSIEVIAPAQGARGIFSDANDNSIVLRLAYGNVSFLMTGDMETSERQSVKRFPRSSVLKLAHHGSSNGTDERILKEVSPDLAIISYGTGNPYGHPHRETMELIRKFNLRSYATANGEIKITTDGHTLKIFQERSRRL
jgi:competence protein ComEC